MTAMDIALSRLWKEHSVNAAIGKFRTWLNITGRSYLAEGLGRLPPGVAFREIMKRAGITEVSGHDDILSTISTVMRLIEERCPPRETAQ